MFLASTGKGDAGYELQILDSFENATYVNGQAASIYKQAPPLVNATRRPGEWNVYDVVWTAPVFNADGTLQSPAAVTVFHNGVLVQDGFRLRGATVFRGEPSYTAHGPVAAEAAGPQRPQRADRLPQHLAAPARRLTDSLAASP